MKPIHSVFCNSGAKAMSKAVGFIMALSVMIAAAQNHPPLRELTPAENAAIERVAAHASSGSGNFAQVLNSIGYSPDIPGFKAFPIVRKIESAYLAAEQGAPGSGKQVIALLSKQITDKYESARQDPTLKAYASLPADPTQLKYVEATSRPRPSPQITSAISTLADYADGNALGGPQGVLRDYFGLSSDQVYTILRGSDSTADAITKGINWVPESQRRRRLSDLVADIDRAYDGAAMMEASLNEYRPKPGATKIPDQQDGQQPRRNGDQKPHKNVVTPPIRDTGNTPPNGHTWRPDDPLNPYTGHGNGGGGGGGGGGGDFGKGGPGESLPLANEDVGQKNFSNFVGDHYTNGPSEFESVAGGGGARVTEAVEQGVFEAVVEGIGGFGGVVFGNSVEETPGLGKPVSLSWIPGSEEAGGQQTGRIAIDFRPASPSARVIHRFYGPVLLEDVYAANRIVYTHEGLPEWSKGQGIGIMSLYDREDYIDCDENRPANQSVYWHALLNPALMNTDLGESAEMVDSLPIVRDKFAAMVIGSDASGLSEDVHDWIESTPGTWKFIDRPMVIGSVGERITIQPKPDRNSTDANLPGDAARYLDVRPFEVDPLVALLHSIEEPGEDPFTTGFARLFPQIVRGSHEFSRVNGFAPVLALFRWAKLSNASIIGSIPVPARTPTPEALLITGNSILQTRALPPNQLRELDRANTDNCLSAITAKLPAPQVDILAHEQSLWKQAALQLESVADAQAAIESLNDRSEYIEKLAGIAARGTPAGRDLLKRLAKAKLEEDDDLDTLKRLLLETFSSRKNLQNYDAIQEEIEKQRAIVDAQEESSEKLLQPALDDWSLSRKLVDAGSPATKSQYDSLMEKETAATAELESLQKEDDKLSQSFDDFEQSCAIGLSALLQRQFKQIKSEETELEFVAQHCAGGRAQIEQALSQQVDIADRKKKATDAKSAAESELRDSIKTALPTIGLWREFSSSYVPISDQEFEKDWLQNTDDTQDDQNDDTKNPPATE